LKQSFGASARERGAKIDPIFRNCYPPFEKFQEPIDSGFLQHVANAEEPEARLLLLNAAYVIGWRYPSLINEYNDTYILNFIIKKGIKCFD